VGVQRFSHLGLCVADLERSLRFYCDGLGFREASRLEVKGEPSDTLLELSDVELEAVYLLRDGFCLELLHYRAPGATGSAAPRAMNAVGLTHLSVRVASLDATAQRLAALGGRVLEQTRIDNPGLGALALFLVDPDGARIELVETAEGALASAEGED
jgi:catechol 2,3-dioxygenase-like lactoylglutathione lyase family enzyme